MTSTLQDYEREHPEDTLPPDASVAERYFYANASYAVGHRVASARKLALAEELLKGLVAIGKARVTWEPADMEWDGDEPLPPGCLHEDLLIEYREDCPTCGNTTWVPFSLSSIAYMPGDKYPRECEAQVALDMIEYINRNNQEKT